MNAGLMVAAGFGLLLLVVGIRAAIHAVIRSRERAARLRASASILAAQPPARPAAPVVTVRKKAARPAQEQQENLPVAESKPAAGEPLNPGPETATPPSRPVEAAAARPAPEGQVPLPLSAPAAPVENDHEAISWALEEQQQRAVALGIPAIFHEACRHIRTWSTSLAPGRVRPEILTGAELTGDDPATYRFRLKERAYSIVRTRLVEKGDASAPSIEKICLINAAGETLCEMELITSRYDSDETPGELIAFVDGDWIEDMKELNALSSRDGMRISDDFRKKLRAKEAERLGKDFDR